MIEHPVQGKRFIIFDCDGTMRRCTVPGQPCPNKPGEWELLPNVREVLAQYPLDVAFGLASNQGGVALGFLTAPQAQALLLHCWDALGMPRHALYTMLCPHHPQAGCSCRKPLPGMLCVLMDMAKMMARDTLYVGDQPSDQEAAVRAGCDFLWAHEFFGWDQAPAQYVPTVF